MGEHGLWSALSIVFCPEVLSRLPFWFQGSNALLTNWEEGVGGVGVGKSYGAREDELKLRRPEVRGGKKVE